jgi:hypothetical protein
MAHEAATSGVGLELGLTFTTEQLGNSQAHISLKASRDGDSVFVINQAKTLKVVPLSICSGFAIREGAGLVRIKLREAQGL